MTEQAGSHRRPPMVNAEGAIVSPKNGRQRIWSAIRVLKRFDRREAEQCSEQNQKSVETYLNALQRAGYVRKIRASSPMHGQLAEYQIVRNTGLKAPTVNQGRRGGVSFREVYDPNTGELHDISPCRAVPSTSGGRK